MTRLIAAVLLSPALLLLPGVAISETPAAETPVISSEVRALEVQKLETTPLYRALPLSPEQQALAAIRDESRLRVGTLAERIKALPDGRERRELQRQAIDLKLEYRIRFLQTKINFARLRGDLTAAAQVESHIERVLEPRFSVPISENDKFIPPTSLKGGRP